MATTAPSTSVTQPWGVGDALIGFLIGTVAQVLLAGALGVGAHPTIGQELILEIPLWLAFLLTPIWAIRSRGADPIVELHVAGRPIDAAGLLIGGATQFVVGWLYVPFVSNRDLERPARQLADSAHGAGGKVMLVLLTCVFAPVFEEFFYRGFLLRAVRRRFSAPIAVVIVAVVFAALHLEPLQLPGLFLFGCVSGFLCLRYDRLGPSVAAHIGFNAVALWQLHIL